MTRPRRMQAARAIPVPVDAAFDTTLPMSLTILFSRWYGPLGPVRAIRDQEGPWGTVGQTRTVVQAGGTTLREELTRVDRPHVFGYTLDQITGPLAPLVDHIDGEWEFAAAGTGTEVTWRWAVYPKFALAAVALPAFERLWRGFARQSLEQLSTELLR